MRIILSISLLAIMPLLAFSQKIDFESVKFDYQKLPLVSLASPAKTYSTTILLPYEAVSAQKKQDWEKYKVDEIARAKKEKEDYDTKQKNTKLVTALLNSGSNEPKPTGLPVFKDEPYIAKVYDKSSVNSYATIPGFEKKDGGEAKLTVTLDGFTVGAITEKIIDPNAPKPGVIYSSTASTTPKPKTVVYEVQVKHVVNIKLENGAGVAVFQNILPGTGDYTKVQTAEFANKGELDNYWAKNQLTFLAAQDDQLYNANMKLLADYLSVNYGFVPTTRSTSVIVIRDKDVNYDEYMQAYEKAMKGYNLLTSPDEAATVTEELNGAIDLWKKALTESDIENKKARINAKVTEATYLNMTEAYVWLNNYAEAENALVKLKTLDLDKYSNKASELKSFIADQKKRYKANTK